MARYSSFRTSGTARGFLLQKNGTQCLLYSCDVTKTSEVIKMVEFANAKLGRIDILVNSAGINPLKMIPDMDDETWKSIIDLNLSATFAVMRETLRIMREQKYGKIINISSMKSVFGVSDGGYVAYCASKGGINMLTKHAACEFAADNITINAIAPTFIRTAMNDHQLEDPKFKKALEDRIPVGRIGQFKDLMGLLLLLASDASEFITGQIILLDGGIAARQ